MKSVLTLIAVFFSLNLWAFVNPIEQEFSLDDPEALEFGLPHVVKIESVEVIATLSSKLLVRVIGTANVQSFDLTRVISSIGPTSEGMYLVKAILWEDSISGENCEESIYKQVAVNFEVSKNNLRTGSYIVSSALNFYRPDLCNSASWIKEFSYSLNK